MQLKLLHLSFLVLGLGSVLKAELPALVAAPISGVFDTLKFGDDRETVLTKLKASKVVELMTDETFIGRSGLNGVFRCRKKVGSLGASLYFDWTASGKLKEINLQTESVSEADYETVVRQSWRDLIDLLGELNGEPAVKGSMPSRSSLRDGVFSPSHLWRLDAGGGILLGTAQDGNRFQVVVRFTSQSVQPLAIP